MVDPDLRELRQRVDLLNLEILELLNRRLSIVQAIREVKERSGERLFNPEREAEEVGRLLSANQGPMTADLVRKVFGEVFRMSLDFMQRESSRELCVHRRPGQPDRIVQVRGHALGGGRPQLVAGPCSVESPEQLRSVAVALRAAGVGFLRGGAFKPRTSPYSFQGLGLRGLEILREVADETGMAVVTEILDPGTLDDCLRLADVLQVGARNMYNYELLRLLGRSEKPVLLKRGFMATLEEFVLSAEYVAKEGNDRIVLCERGIRTHETWTRNTLDLSAVPLLKMETPFPVVVDVSHGTGRKDIVVPMARAALAAGADGIMIEVHPHPAQALSDNAQQLDVDEFGRFVRQVLGP